MEYTLAIYLASRADVIISISAISLAILSGLLVYYIAEISTFGDEDGYLKKRCNRLIKAIAACLTVIILLPTSSQIKYIAAGYVLDSASSDVKRVASKSVILFEKWLDSQNKE